MHTVSLFSFLFLVISNIIRKYPDLLLGGVPKRHRVALKRVILKNKQTNIETYVVVHEFIYEQFCPKNKKKELSLLKT